MCPQDRIGEENVWGEIFEKSGFYVSFLFLIYECTDSFLLVELNLSCFYNF